jgi:Bacterial Ig domain
MSSLNQEHIGLYERFGAVDLALPHPVRKPNPVSHIPHITAPSDKRVERRSSEVVDVHHNYGGSSDALDPNTLRIDQPPVDGTAIVNADKTITYTSRSSYRGTDSFA